MIIETIDSITIQKPKDVSIERKGHHVDYTDSEGNVVRREYKYEYLIVEGKLDNGKPFEYRIYTPYTSQLRVDGKLYSEYKVGHIPEVEFETTDLFGSNPVL